MKKTFIFIFILLLFGCASDETMKDRFGDGSTQVMSDVDGNEYYVRHSFGNNYSIEPVRNFGGSHALQKN